MARGGKMRQETRMSAYLEGTAKTTLGLRPRYREQVFPSRQQKKSPAAGGRRKAFIIK
jgi:hypothetical protein